MGYFPARNRRGEKKVIKVGQFEVGSRVYVQECRKCGARHESTRVLFLCQNRDVHCNGAMTPVQDSYDVESVT